MKMRLSNLCLCIVFVFLGMNLSAQDFSFSEFENEKDSSKRIEMGIEGASFYRKNNLDSLKILSVHLLATKNKNSSSFESALSNRYLGTYSIRTSDINRGVVLLKEAREVFSNFDLVVLLSETENELGNAFFLQGNYNQASRYYFTSIVHGSQASDITARYNGMIGFGKTVCAIGDTAKGLLFIQEYLERCLRDSKFESASDACGYLGMIAGLKGRVELMSAYYNRGIRYASKSDSKTHRANAYTNKAIDYFYHDKVDSAKYFFYEALSIRQEVGATRPIVESWYNLALLNIELKNFDHAKGFAEKGELLARNGGIRSWQLDCLKLLLEISENTHNLSEIRKIKMDIDRIQNELEKVGTLDDQIIDTAVEFTALNSTPIRQSFFWELIAISSLVLSCGFILYLERANSA
ncbi:MAG: hypothetical protein HRT58_16830 [Crocinitomicaceae bacterium]|nr:hypothetical protein [Flavobacteriales bacterium]NQZ37333.1 hypothetical protein [Crocinitomicaceae bacterium]